MSARLSLGDLRRIILRDLTAEWVTPAEMTRRLGVGNGTGYYMVALVLERLAADGRAEIRASGNRRKFRRAA